MKNGYMQRYSENAHIPVPGDELLVDELRLRQTVILHEGLGLQAVRPQFVSADKAAENIGASKK